jgi:hypothetical protein
MEIQHTKPYVECSLNISSRIHFLRVLQCFLGPLVFGCSILSNHPKKNLTSIGDASKEQLLSEGVGLVGIQFCRKNYPNIRKLMKCWFTIKTVLECGEIFSNLLFSRFQISMKLLGWGAFSK